MPRRDHTGDRNATLYARSELPRPAAERRNAVGRLLTKLVEADALARFDVVHWAKRIPVQGVAGREQILLSEFRDWADRRGVDLAPCFETRQCYSQESGQRREERVMPALCLAVYEGDELVELAPHATTDGVVTVSEALETLQREGDTGESSEAPGERSQRENRQPETSQREGSQRESYDPNGDHREGDDRDESLQMVD